MPVSISGDGAITGLELEEFEDVDVGSGAADGDVLTYDASGDLWIPQGIVLPAGIGSNVVQTVKTDTFSTTSASFVDVTGLTATITPSSATAKILIIAQTNLTNTNPQNNTAVNMKLAGGNTSNYIGDAAGSRTRTVGNMRTNADFRPGETMLVQSLVFLDAPASTSPVTYSVQVLSVGGGAAIVNVATNDSDASTSSRGASSLTAIEVAA
jgi:formylmethanofuran dehydrogenase subunit D